ncbi:MAG: DUF3604 domain-containing protein [Halieaceae bacterium]
MPGSGLRSIGLLLVVSAGFSSVTLSEEKQLLWGDTHLHSTYSSDAFTNGNLTATPDTAYRYAKGMPVVHPGHQARVQIGTPLDFLVVSDHAEYLGVIRSLYLNPMVTDGLTLRERLWTRFVQYLLRDAIDEQTGRKLFTSILPKPSENAVTAMEGWEEDRVSGLIPRQPTVEVDTWRLITETADAHNEPGEFTALIGWEYSLIPGGANLHRIVLGDIDAAQAQTFAPFGFDDSSFPSDLWAWLDETSQATGGNFIAIPHNSNISKGSMFDVRDIRGDDIDLDYAEIRRYWEPVVEITQIKGDSETHPALSPDDPFADFETYPYYIQREWTDYVPQRGDYIRSGLKTGLELAASIGANPYQFGVIGSTDAHTALPSAEEDNFHGKMATDSIPSRKDGGWSEDARGTFGWGMSASGLAAVWATENTREAIVAAMRRREVYATSGPRIAVRTYGGLNLKEAAIESAAFPADIQSQAVPMGGEIIGAANEDRFSLIVEAQADPKSAYLDRIQIIKGWIDASGQTHERIFDAAVSGAERRLADGSVMPVGSSVDLKTGLTANTIGSPRLSVVWHDPEFDPEQSAFYYARVLQIPTARHSLLDKLALGDDGIDTRRPDTIQERAYTSPIWYRPSVSN